MWQSISKVFGNDVHNAYIIDMNFHSSVAYGIQIGYFGFSFDTTLLGTSSSGVNGLAFIGILNGPEKNVQWQKTHTEDWRFKSIDFSSDGTLLLGLTTDRINQEFYKLFVFSA